MVAVYRSAISLVVCPRDVTHRVTSICHFVVINYFAYAIDITASADFVPWVIWNAVLVLVFRYHYDACLVHASKHQVLHLLIGISPYGKITLTRNIGNRVVEMEGDIASPTT